MARIDTPSFSEFNCQEGGYSRQTNRQFVEMLAKNERLHP